MLVDGPSPGRPVDDLSAAWLARCSKKHGVEKESRIGYSIGLSYPPDWGERTISVRPGDDDRMLQANMTLHLIPAMWMEDFGLEITEAFLVTETGAECLCSTPRELFVKP